MFDIETARKMLIAAEIFDVGEEDEKFRQTIFMNDVWAWAYAYCEYVPDDKLQEVAGLFWKYGWGGLLYWVSEQRGVLKSEFLDNNRFIEFVRHEEKLIKEIPDADDRAYHKLSYTLGEYDHL